MVECGHFHGLFPPVPLLAVDVEEHCTGTSCLDRHEATDVEQETKTISLFICSAVIAFNYENNPFYNNN